MGRATDQWMPLYVADYLRDTQDLSTEEHGAYLLLLMRAWTSDGLLPNDDERLRRIVRMDAKAWKRSRGVLLDFFQKGPDGLRHKRVDAELERAGELVEKRRSAGKASAEARARKKAEATDGQRNGNTSSTHVEDVLPETASTPPTEGQRNGRPLPLPVTEEPIPTPDSDSEPPRAALPDGFDQVVAAAGLRITAKNRDREAAVLAGWVGIGLGLEEIIKEIRRVLAEKDGPTSTLGRFDRGLRDLAARRALPKAEPAPAVPRGRDDCEDGPVIRQAMLAELGEKTYASWLRPCDLRREGETLIVSAPSTLAADWIRNHLADRVRVAARAKLVEVRAA